MISPKTCSEIESGKSFSAVEVVHCILEDAFFAKASDVHIHPTDISVSVRFRIDGLLCDAVSFSRKVFSEIVSRIKILAHLRTDEHRRPQDGRFKHSLSDSFFDVRVSFVPTQYGESIVMRLLSNTLDGTTLESLGFLQKDLETLERVIKKQSGMIVVTGPTGSGKTTTLYTIVKKLCTPDVSIVTIEDPIEYELSGVKQIQTNEKAGLTFSSGLRSILRQDPDIIMVGEIRDHDTAQIAINTALTGHLLLSTLHTIDSATAIPRLLDMGIEPFLVASTLRTVVAQRLVRKLCEHCKKSRLPDFSEKELCRKEFGYDLMHLSEAIGCEKCKNTGYDGRVIVAEILSVDDFIRDAILSRTSAVKIKNLAVELGMTPLAHDGLKKVEMGLTSLNEIIRCLYE